MSRQVLSEDAGFTWIDVVAPDADDRSELAERFGIDLERWPMDLATRPSMFEEERFTVVTLVGSDGSDGLLGFHCFAAPTWLVTTHDHPSPDIDAMAQSCESPSRGLDLVARTVVTSLVERVSDLDAKIEAIEDGRDDGLASMRRCLADLRKVVLPQRDVLTRLGHANVSSEASARGLRNSAERMAQVGTELETLREALHDANTDRQNEVVRRLTLVAALFLPLTFLTGFFGQNFPWMVDHIGGLGWFLGFGIGLPVVAVGGLFALLLRRGWL